MLTNYCWKFQIRNVQTFGFVYHDTNGLNNGPVWKIQAFLLSEICTVILWQDCYGKRQFEKILLKYMVGRRFPNWECLYSHTVKKDYFLSVYVDDTKLAGKKQSINPMWKNTKQRSWFGRTNIFPWSCSPGMYSRTMWNEQKYCGQLQNHVWIENFRGENRKASILWEFSNFFMVLWYGWSCKEMRGTILWVGNEQETTQQLYRVSTPCIDDHHSKEEQLKYVGELSEVCSQIDLKCLYLALFGRPEILWSVNKLARSITKWTKACDKRLSRLISYIHHTCNYNQYCHMGNTAKQCGLGLFQDSDFARDLEDSKSTSGGTFCVFGSHTYVPISWMCKKQTFSFALFNRIRNLFFGCRIEVGW